MANHASAKKRIRQTKKRTLRNMALRSRVRSAVRRVEEALQAADSDAATKAMASAAPLLQQSAGKGIFHANTVSRKISRLSRRLNALGAS